MTTTEYPMVEVCRAAAVRFARRLRAIHEVQGCPTRERYTYQLRSTVDGNPVEGSGCREHDIFATAEG